MPECNVRTQKALGSEVLPSPVAASVIYIAQGNGQVRSYVNNGRILASTRDINSSQAYITRPAFALDGAPVVVIAVALD